MFPMLQNTLIRLVNITEKIWGYVQVRNKDNVYVLHLLGSDENIMNCDRQASKFYELNWHTKLCVSVFVDTNMKKKFYNKTPAFSK